MFGTKVSNTIVVSILIAISVVNQTTAILCCNDEAYTIYHKCIDSPNESKWVFSFDYAYIKHDSDIQQSLCKTLFCSDGTEMDGDCGYNCIRPTGCACGSCRTNNGTSYKDMEKAWVIEHGFPIKCKSQKFQTDSYKCHKIFNSVKG